MDNKHQEEIEIKKKSCFTNICYTLVQSPYTDKSVDKNQANGYKDFIEWREGYRLEDTENKEKVTCLNIVYLVLDFMILLLVFLTWARIGDFREQLEWVEKAYPEVFGSLLILGFIDILLYVIIWIIFTIVCILASIIGRIRLMKQVQRGYVPKKDAIFENYLHLVMIALFILVLAPFNSLSVILPEQNQINSTDEQVMSDSIKEPANKNLQKMLFYCIAALFIRLIRQILRFLAALYLMTSATLGFLTREKVNKGRPKEPTFEDNSVKQQQTIQDIIKANPECDGIIMKGIQLPTPSPQHRKDIHNFDFNEGFETPKFEMTLDEIQNVQNLSQMLPSNINHDIEMMDVDKQFYWRAQSEIISKEALLLPSSSYKGSWKQDKNIQPSQGKIRESARQSNKMEQERISMMIRRMGF